MDYLKSPDYPIATDAWNILRLNFTNFANSILDYHQFHQYKTQINSPTEEEIELQGFVPISDTLTDTDFSLEKLKEPSEEAKIKRISKIISFALAAAEYEWIPNEKYFYFDEDSNKFSLTSGVSLFSTNLGDDTMVNINDERSDEDLGDEILFNPENNDSNGIYDKTVGSGRVNNDDLNTLDDFTRFPLKDLKEKTNKNGNSYYHKTNEPYQFMSGIYQPQDIYWEPSGNIPNIAPIPMVYPNTLPPKSFDPELEIEPPPGFEPRKKLTNQNFPTHGQPLPTSYSYLSPMNDPIPVTYENIWGQNNFPNTNYTDLFKSFEENGYKKNN